ncbi:hexitol phosphatase HxpB [Escherichia coli]
MSTPRQILAAIFDMDGLLIDSEPLWDRAELDVMASLGVDISRRNELPDTLGLRIDMVVDLWYARQPWNGPSRQEVVEQVIARAISLVEETRPLLPGVREAVALCKEQGLLVGLASASPLHMLEKVLTMFEVVEQVIARAISLVEETRPLLPGVREAVALCKEQGLLVGLASASPLHMLEKVLTMFDLRDSFDALASAEKLPYSKPHPQVYLDCAAKLGVDPLTCVALEDSVNGMIASKAARMRSIVVPAPEAQNDPRFVLANVKLSSLTELTAKDLLG